MLKSSGVAFVCSLVVLGCGDGTSRRPDVVGVYVASPSQIFEAKLTRAKEGWGELGLPPEERMKRESDLRRLRPGAWVVLRLLASGNYESFMCEELPTDPPSPNVRWRFGSWKSSDDELTLTRSDGREYRYRWAVDGTLEFEFRGLPLLLGPVDVTR